MLELEKGEQQMQRTKMMRQNCVILIPALNPPESFLLYLEQLGKCGFEHIIVVDDGSGAEKRRLFEQAEKLGCVVLRHERNRGKGAALKTGFAYYLEHFQGNCDGVVTVNSDGSDVVEDVQKIAQALHEEQAAGKNVLVLGARDFSGDNVSRAERWRNRIGRGAYRFLLGIQVQDTLTGLRGVPDAMIPECVTLPGDGYEYETSKLIQCEASGYREVPVQTPAVKRDEKVHYRVKDMLQIYFVIFRKFLRFVMISLFVSALDIFLFWLLTEYFLTGIAYPIVWGTVIARGISASINYVMNRYLVFRSNEDQRKSASMFLALTVVQGSLSALFVQLLEVLSSADPVVLKVIVDVGLFFVSYKVQHGVIFKKEKED